jgi:hypothetical protein
MNQAQSSQIPDLIGALLAAGDLEQLHAVTLHSLLEVMGFKAAWALLLVRESEKHFTLGASVELEDAQLPVLTESRLVAQHENGREGWNAAQSTSMNVLEVMATRERSGIAKRLPVL